MSSVVAAAGLYLLASVAPFETTRPILRLPGQALTNVEAALLAALGAWALTLVWSRRMPDVPPAARAWIALVGVMALASLLASAESRNAWHMTGRLAAAGAVLLLAFDAVRTGARLHTAMSVIVIAGVLVAVAAILEYAQIDPALRLLRAFRPALNVIGGQVRAGGTLQYPTIASMYLEIVFAVGAGLMLYAVDRSHPGRAALWGAALLITWEAIVLTFTRTGLLAGAATIATAAALRFRQRGFEQGGRLLLAVSGAMAALLAASHSTGSLWLRFTSDGQDAWYRADIDPPPTLSMAADRLQHVTVSLTNTGRATWDSNDDPPILLSYHWLLPDDDRVVAFEGERTPFDRPVAPGETVLVHALVRAPQYPGRYRLEWDLAQEGRLWFSTEQDAPPARVSCASVTGPARGAAPATTAHPRRAVRPGRLVLWRAAARMLGAHPFLGVGPDNFRLLYGPYAGLIGADPRTHSNNMYLEIVAGGGLLAAAAFAWFLREAARIVAAIVASTDPRLLGAAAASGAIAVHGLVDSFLSFAPTYILFALTLGITAAAARLGPEMPNDAHRV